MRVIATTTLVLIISVVSLAAHKPKTYDYKTGRLLNVAVKDVNRGVAVMGGLPMPLAVPISGRLYVFEIRFEDIVYSAEYKAGKNSYKPEWIVNDPIRFRVQKDKMFLKRPDGKELEVSVIRRERQN